MLTFILSTAPACIDRFFSLATTFLLAGFALGWRKATLTESSNLSQFSFEQLYILTYAKKNIFFSCCSLAFGVLFVLARHCSQ